MKANNTIRIVGGLSALLWAGSLYALDVRGFACKQGDCINGQGTVWNAMMDMSIEGLWSNGRTIPGKTYVVTSPLAPSAQFKQVYGQDGLLERGDMPFRYSHPEVVGAFYNGSYGRIRHDFTHEILATPTIGVYNDGNGIEYRGRFEFLPSKHSSDLPVGYFFFYGDRVDTEENEKETGLFVSDETFEKWGLRLFKANERYVTQIQQKYQHDLAQIKAEERAKEESERNGFQWTKFGALMAGAAIGGLDHLDSGEKVKVISSMLQDSMPGQQGVSSFNKSMQDISTQREEQKVQQSRVVQQARAQQEAMASEAANNERLLKAAKESRQPRERLAQADARNREYGSSNAYGDGKPSPSVIGTKVQGEPSSPKPRRKKYVQNGFGDGGARAATPELAIEQDIAQLKKIAEKWVAERKKNGSVPVHGVITDMRVRDGCTTHKQNEGDYWSRCILDITYEADE